MNEQIQEPKPEESEFDKRVAQLKDRSRAGEDVSEEAASLLFKHQASEARRIEYGGLPRTDEEARLVRQQRDDLEALATDTFI